MKSLISDDTAAKIMNNIATKGLRGSVLATASAIKAQSLALITSPMAPYAVAAVGLGAAFVAVNDNVGGLRDSIEDLTGQERGSLPTLGVSLTGLIENSTQSSEKLRDYKKEAEDFAISVETIQIPANKKLSKSHKDSTKSLNDLSKAMNNLNNNLK